MINNKIKYFRLIIHGWLKFIYGKANKCESKKCNHKSKHYVWAKLKNKEYDFKRANFWMLCASCHRLYDMTDEIRLKMSKSAKGKHNGFYGKQHSKETKRKMSINNKGNTITNRKGKKNGMYGKTHSKEAKKRISDANRGNHLSEETKRKMLKTRKRNQRKNESKES